MFKTNINYHKVKIFTLLGRYTTFSQGFSYSLHTSISPILGYSSCRSVALICLLCHRYNPVTKNVTVKSEGAIQVNFTLVRSSTDSNNESKKGKGDSTNADDASDPTTKEFETLIKDLSAENGLEDLMLRSSSNLALYRYHSYKDLSEFLRGLVMNYPHITNLTR